MKIALFYHSVLSDWNHGNAHFLRGVATELVSRGDRVELYEPENSWSVANLVQDHGTDPIKCFHAAYPTLQVRRYRLESLDLDQALSDADLVIVHEWNDPALVKRIGEHKAGGNQYSLFFHDTHHRMVTAPETMARYDLEHYDGVLAYGRVLQDLYLSQGRARHAWTWHEAADTRVFHPLRDQPCSGGLVWIGNWGDDERTEELQEFLIEPCRHLQLKARVHGVRYPEHARAALRDAGIDYAGWLPNFDVPNVLAGFRVTLHVPRRPYVRALPGIPTIRPFEALACGIPLVCSPWEDCENLFRPGTDFLMARNGREMTSHLKSILSDVKLAETLAANGLATIRKRHTCAHRVDELLAIHQEVSCQLASAATQTQNHVAAIVA